MADNIVFGSGVISHHPEELFWIIFFLLYSSCRRRPSVTWIFFVRRFLHNSTTIWLFFHGLWMDNVCRSKFEDRLNRFKSYGQKSGQIWVCERFFEKSRGIFIDSIRFFAFLSGTDVQGRWSELRQR